MVNSTRYSYLLLRLGLAAVFLWFGIDKFIHPQYWIHSWLPVTAAALAAKVGIGAVQLMFLNGIFEVLVALSLITGVFIRFFSLCAALFLAVALLWIKPNETTIRDIALIGGLACIFLWPERQR